MLASPHGRALAALLKEHAAHLELDNVRFKACGVGLCGHVGEQPLSLCSAVQQEVHAVAAPATKACVRCSTGTAHG
jgi:hypothetical protein